jgi:hypothetical protein
MKLAVFCVVLAAVAPGAAAQGTVNVEGVVVNKVTGAGIGGATVRFIAPKSDRYETTSDETGAFRISGIKPGDYRSLAEKHGYFSSEIPTFAGGNTQRFNAGGDPIRLRLELIPPAVIHGRVLGADGNPASASVDLGRGRTASTNSEGAFVFENIEPGRYTLLARPKTSEPIKPREGPRTEVVPTYYPSAVDPSQAESIVVRPGAELNGDEIRLQSVSVYRVRGVVLNPDGKPAAKAVVELQARIAGEDSDRYFFLGGTSSHESFSIRTHEIGLPETEEPFVTGDDGVFEFPSVRAGDWTLRAEGEPVGDEVQREGVSSVASTIFSLGNGDPDDLKIQLAAPFHLSGSAVLSDGSPIPEGVLLAVSFYSETGRAGSGGTVEPRGALRLDVMPGADEIRADVLLGNYYADSILLGSTDVTNQRAELTRASPPIKVILKPAGTIRGTIEDADAGTVVLFPQSFTGIAYSAQSRAGNAFELDGIPPGDYDAIALDRFDARTMAEAVRLRSLMPMATSVRVEQGSAASVQLKVHHVAD